MPAARLYSFFVSFYLLPPSRAWHAGADLVISVQFCYRMPRPYNSALPFLSRSALIHPRFHQRIQFFHVRVWLFRDCALPGTFNECFELCELGFGRLRGK